MKKFLPIVVFLFFIIFIKLFFFYPANSNVRKKLEMIEDEVAKRGYHTKWIIISGKRSVFYNNLLSNSAKNSNHIRGNAIDILVYDIDGNGKFDKKDISILMSANDFVEKNYPKYSGSFGTYTSKGFFTKHMIHIEVTGRKKYYNK